MPLADRITLGPTGMKVGRLGIASSYGAPITAYELAFEHGCNYFAWGTFGRRRSPAMQAALRNIVAAGKRAELVLAMVSYAHVGLLTERFLRRGLRALGTDYADLLLLGYYGRLPSPRMLDRVQRLKAAGLVRYTGLTTHNRRLPVERQNNSQIDVFHLRYSAVHRGAEIETFPHLSGTERPGIVAFTATNWGRLVDARRMPPGITAPTAADCYRYALSAPAVDVCMTGARSIEQMRQNLTALERDVMTDAELERMRKIGDWIYGQRRAARRRNAG